LDGCVVYVHHLKEKRMQGDLVPIWYCECGQCMKAILVNRKEGFDAVCLLTDQGWLKMRDWGWVCPTCDHTDENDEDFKHAERGCS
jgi:hypothetical protein